MKVRTVVSFMVRSSVGAWGAGQALFLAWVVTTHMCLLSKHLLTCAYTV